MFVKPYKEIDTEIKKYSAEIRRLRAEKKKMEKFFGTANMLEIFSHDFPNLEYTFDENGTPFFYAGAGSEKFCNTIGFYLTVNNEQLKFIPQIICRFPSCEFTMPITHDDFLFAFVLPKMTRLDNEFARECFPAYSSGKSKVYVWREWKDKVLVKLPEFPVEFFTQIEYCIKSINVDNIKSES